MIYLGIDTLKGLGEKIKKMIDPYYRPTNKKIVEQKLRDYLEKTYGDFYVADGMTFGPYCSDWVKDLTKKKGELEKITDAELLTADLTNL